MMQNSLGSTALRAPRKEEFHFFKEFSTNRLKKPMKTTRFSHLQLFLSDYYDLFLEFIQLLYLFSFQGEPIYLSKIMVQRQQFSIFYFYTGSKDTNGFRRLNISNWLEEVLLFWRCISQITVSDSFIREYSEMLEEWRLWMSSLQKREILSFCVDKNWQKQGYLSFIQMFHRLKISLYFSFDIRINSYLISNRIKHNQILTDILSQGFGEEDRRQLSNLSQEFEAIIQRISRLIIMLQQQRLIGFVVKQKLGLFSGSDEEKQHVQQIKSASNRNSQVYHFLLRINIGQNYAPMPETIYLPSNSRIVEVSRQMIRISVTIQRRDRIIIIVTTTPYWKLYPLAFANIKATIEATAITLARQGQKLKGRPRLLDFFGLKLSLQDDKEETKICLRECLSGNVERQRCVGQVLQCIEKQLMVWAVLEKELERACRVYVGQMSDRYSINCSQERFRTQMLKGIEVVDSQLSLLADKYRS